MEARNYTIYLHRNKINGKIYVGQTCEEDPIRRWHTDGSGYKKQAFYAAIQKYGWENFEHEILETGLTQEEANEKEVFYIAKYDSYNNGYNATEGGKNRRLSEEEKQKISKFMSETRQGKNNPSHKEIICLNTMRTFDCIADAGRWCNIAPANISACAKGKRNFAGQDPATGENLFWCFQEDYSEDKIAQFKIAQQQFGQKKSTARKRVQQLDLNNNLISEYENCADAARKAFNDISKHKGISRCASGQRATAFGFKWRYV